MQYLLTIILAVKVDTMQVFSCELSTVILWNKIGL